MKATPLLSSLFICGVSTLAHLMFNSLLVWVNAAKRMAYTGIPTMQYAC